MNFTTISNYFCIYLGLIVGAIIRYGASTNGVTYIDVHPASDTKYNQSVPPDMLRLYFPDKIQINSGGMLNNIHYCILKYDKC